MYVSVKRQVSRTLSRNPSLSATEGQQDGKIDGTLTEKERMESGTVSLLLCVVHYLTGGTPIDKDQDYSRYDSLPDPPHPVVQRKSARLLCVRSWLQLPAGSYQRLKKWYLMLPC